MTDRFVCIYALDIFMKYKEILELRTCLRVIFGAGTLRNSKYHMDLVCVIASQVQLPSLLCACGTATSPDFSARGAPKANLQPGAG